MPKKTVVKSVASTERFAMKFTSEIRTDSGRSIKVYGEPLHMDAAGLIAQYKNSTQAEFLMRERRHSAGNYLIVDQSGRRTLIVTSTGYCGGYIRKTASGIVVSTALRDAIHADVNSVKFDAALLSYLVTYVPNSTWGSVPVSTFIQGVTRLNAASLLEITGNEVSQYHSYLPLHVEKPATAMDAVLETAQHYADTYRRTGMAPELMFSGGADSLVILLAMQAIMGKGAVRSITVRTSRHESTTNGHYRAIPVARALGVDVDLITADWESEDAVLSETRAMMRLDILNGRKPDLALANGGRAKTIVMHGQNMDALVSNNMTQLQVNLDRGLLSNEQLALVTDETIELKQLQTLLGNMQYIKAFSEDPTFQAMVNGYLQKSRSSTMLDPAPGTELGILRGMIATQVPNLLNAPREPFSRFSQLAIMTEEAQRFSEFLGVKPSSAGSVDAARYYGYMQLANKRGCTSPLSNGTMVSFFPMSGPMISYFHDRGRNLADAAYPKREIYDVIQKLSGRTYSELNLPLNAADYEKMAEITKNNVNSKDDPFVESCRSLLNPESSRLFSHIATPDFLKVFQDVYRKAEEGSKAGSKSFALFHQSVARVLINLELLFEPDIG